MKNLLPQFWLLAVLCAGSAAGETRGEEPEAFRTDSAGSSEGFGSNDYEW